MAETIRQDKRDQSIRKILDAALLIFATKGFNGARIDEIAHKAHVNKAMIYYRIGNKLALYQAVIHDIYSDRAKELQQMIQSRKSPREKLKKYIATVAAVMETHPYFTKIMIREMVSGWTNFGQVIFEEVSVTFNIVQSIIDEGVEKGVFAKADPLAVHTMIIGTLILHYLCLPVKKEIQAAFEALETPSASKGFDQLLPEIQRLILASLAPGADQAITPVNL